MTTAPTHIVAHCWDNRSLCGIKDPLPVVTSRYVDAHVAGHGTVVCLGCAAVTEGMPVPAPPQPVSAEQKVNSPSLFDLIAVDAEADDLVEAEVTA